MLPSVQTSHGSRSPSDENDGTPQLPFIASLSHPRHPIARFQGAFDESIMESTESGDSSTDDHRVTKIDAASRRQQLMELEDFGEEYSSRWRQKPGAKFHPLWKLIAQISFGVHLLQQNLARSDEEVLRILQVHVDEVDGFLEETTADFDLARKDVQERIRLLRLPLGHGETFNTMLNDKEFRHNIIEGNDVIERIIDRTTRAMSNSLLDVNKGIDATAELAKFLDRMGSEWTKNDGRLLEIYNTMRGNAEGWYRTFIALQEKAESLKKLLTELGVLVTEMSRRAGAASRRQRASSAKPASQSAPATNRTSRNKSDSFNKPLPPDPLQRLLAKNSANGDQPPPKDFRRPRGSPIESSPSRQDHHSSRHSSSTRGRQSRSRSSEQQGSKQDGSKKNGSKLHTPPATIDIRAAAAAAASSPKTFAEKTLMKTTPAELADTSHPSDRDDNFSTLIPVENEQRPATSSALLTNRSGLGSDPASIGSTPLSAVDTLGSSDSGGKSHGRRHSSSEARSSDLLNDPKLNQPVTALPPYQASGAAAWPISRKGLSSVKGMFGKKRALNEPRMAMLV